MEISIQKMPVAEAHEIIPGAATTARQIYDMVEEFHTVFNHPVRLEVITAPLLTLRSRLICEESRTEGLAALTDGDLEKYLDALADTAYVEMGTLVAFDGGLEHALSTSRDEIVKAWQAPLTAPLTTQMLGHTMMFAGWLGDGFSMVSNDDSESVWVDALPRLCAGLYVSLQLKMRVCEALGVDLVALVAAAHESNMTKLWPADKNALEEALAASKYQANDIIFTPCESRSGLVGCRKSDGKVLKSPTYSEIMLTDFTQQAASSELWTAFSNG